MNVSLYEKLLKLTQLKNFATTLVAHLPFNGTIRDQFLTAVLIKEFGWVYEQVCEYFTCANKTK